MTKLEEMERYELRNLERLINDVREDYGDLTLEEFYDKIWDILEPEDEEKKVVKEQ